MKGACMFPYRSYDGAVMGPTNGSYQLQKTSMKQGKTYKVLVVMPYRYPWSEVVTDAVLRIEELDIKRNFQVYRADMQGIIEEDLDDNVELINSQSDIIIADITECNANVMIEVGGALA